MICPTIDVKQYLSQGELQVGYRRATYGLEGSSFGLHLHQVHEVSVKTPLARPQPHKILSASMYIRVIPNPHVTPVESLCDPYIISRTSLADELN